MSILVAEGFDTVGPLHERCEVCDRWLRGTPGAVRAVSVVQADGGLRHHLVCSQMCEDLFLLLYR